MPVTQWLVVALDRTIRENHIEDHTNQAAFIHAPTVSSVPYDIASSATASTPTALR